MQTSTALATTENTTRALTNRGATALDLIDVMDDLLKVGRFFVESGMMPNGVNTASKAALIIWKGHELGIKPMQAVTGINVIQGRPSVAPQLMLNKILQSNQAEFFKFVESTDKVCTIHAKRKNGWEHTESFTIEEAGKIMSKEDGKTIPLTQKFNWKNQPKVMLRWRCVSAIGRLIFPDIIEGCHIPDELEDEQVAFDSIVPEPSAGTAETAAAQSTTQTGTIVDAEFEQTQTQQAPTSGTSSESAGQAAGTAPVKTVSAPQAKALVKAMKENNINEGEFLKKNDLASIESLPASRFQETLKEFNAAKGTAGTPANAPQQPKTVTEEQAKTLQELVDKLGPNYDKSKLFAHFKIKALSELPADNYTFVHETLAKKLAA